MANNLDKQYTALLQDILDNGVKKQDRTGTGTLSLFGRQIRHKMSDGFPLLTTKKLHWKSIVGELLWFLKGDTNIKWLVENGISIWNGDCYKRYWNSIETSEYDGFGPTSIKLPTLTQEEFINKIKTDDEFAKKWGELGPVYGKQWRSWNGNGSPLTKDYEGNVSSYLVKPIDQIANLIHDLKTNPDSRRLMVNAWNVGELDSMVLPPCHYSWQVYTRELSVEERYDLIEKDKYTQFVNWQYLGTDRIREVLDEQNIPKRAISLMWNQRSVDTFLGLPFNIASYGLLLEIIAKVVNMVPDELIGNLGDTHLYSNHVEQAKEQIGGEFTEEEIVDHLRQGGMDALKDKPRMEYISKLPKRTREPYPLPTLNINTEFWPTESGECGVGLLHSDIDVLIKNIQIDDFEVIGYQSHSTIKAPLSN
jgi:thymidylate synthase